ncbi:hypothetical protein BDFB_009522, partial [Asbolus verrucosus]
MEMTELGKIFSSKVNRTTFAFLQSQLTQQSKKKRGRSYTLEDKVLGLLLMKHNPRGYKLLQKVFALPSQKILMAALRKVPFEDRMDGLEDDGAYRTTRIADHAMVLMLKGVSKKWKQPIAYFFMDCGMKSPNMAKYIKAAIHEVQAIGLKVVVTMCDRFNKPTINLLVEESKSELARKGEQHQTYSFFINGREVMPLYDSPQFIKFIKRHSQQYVEWRRETYEVAKWEHIIKLYELDRELEHGIDPTDVNVSDYRMMNPLTDAHMYPNVIVFPRQGEQTANFLLFVDRLFESVSGSLITPAGGKLLKRTVQSNSPHCAFWMEAIQVLKTIKYRKNGGREYVPPIITNWIVTLDGLLNLWRKLQVVRFEFLLTRNLNQDAIEKLFGPSSNCEDDDTEGALDCFKVFLLDNPEHEMHGVFAHSEASVSE